MFVHFLYQDWAAQRCTISYRAPELFNVESHCIIDERTDIWVILIFVCFKESNGYLRFNTSFSKQRELQNNATIQTCCFIDVQCVQLCLCRANVSKLCPFLSLLLQVSIMLCLWQSVMSAVANLCILYPSLQVVCCTV